MADTKGIVVALSQTLKQNLDVIAKEIVEPYIKETLKDQINSDVYGRESSWERTFSFLNAVDSETERTTLGFEITAYTNPDLMSPDPHTSWATGQNVDEHMTEWLNDGHRKGLANEDYPATNFIENAQEEINKNVLRLIKTKLK